MHRAINAQEVTEGWQNYTMISFLLCYWHYIISGRRNESEAHRHAIHMGEMGNESEAHRHAIHMGEMGNESNIITDDPWIEV